MTLGKQKKGFTYNDVILSGSSENSMRVREVNLNTSIVARTHWIPGIHLRIPFLYANPDTSLHGELVTSLAHIGGMSIVQKTFSPIEQACEVRYMKKIPILEHCSHDALGRLVVAADVGIGADAQERVYRLLAQDVDAVVIDAMHDRVEYIVETIALIRRISRFTPIIAGRVYTAEDAMQLADAGANTVLINVIKSRLSVIADIAKTFKGKNIPIIAYDNFLYSGDVAKALAAGASATLCSPKLEILQQCLAGLHSSLRFFRCRTIRELQRNTYFIPIMTSF